MIKYAYKTWGIKNKSVGLRCEAVTFDLQIEVNRGPDNKLTVSSARIQNKAKKENLTATEMMRH